MGCDGERERERKKDDRRTDGRTASTNFALPNIFGVKTSDFVATYKTQHSPGLRRNTYSKLPRATILRCSRNSVNNVEPSAFVKKSAKFSFVFAYPTSTIFFSTASFTAK